MLYFLASWTTPIILILAAFEGILFISLYRSLHSRSIKLNDSLQNVLRGCALYPEQDSTLEILEKLAGLTHTLRYILEHNTPDKQKVLHNLRSQDVRKIDLKIQKLRSRSNVAASLVGIFVLLGIFGTVTSLGGSQTVFLVLHCNPLLF